MPASFVVSATSSDPPNNPQDPDIVITVPVGGPATVQLCASRNGNGTGRLYTVTATGTDQAGNTDTSTATCTVPHDQGSH